MAKRALLAVMLLISSVTHAQTGTVDEDGFTHPLRNLEFNPGLDQREFERAAPEFADSIWSARHRHPRSQVRILGRLS